jgi:hypothetical protein
MENINSNNDHSRISPTAKITAYWRSLSDIPYSEEISEAAGAEQTAREILGDRIVEMGIISPALFEMRYKSINYGIKKCGLNNVMELASGLTPRGLQIASEGGVYVGTDLPEMFDESAPIIKAIAAKANIPLNNLHLQPANVLDEQEMKTAASYFNGEKFAICNEGLLMYLNLNEKKKMAENIRKVLLYGGGFWITTDIIFKLLREAIVTMFGAEPAKIIRPALKNISNLTGRDISASDFADKSEAFKFYQDIGFSILEYPMYDGQYALSTISRLDTKFRKRFFEILSSAKAWILTPLR